MRLFLFLLSFFFSFLSFLSRKFGIGRGGSFCPGFFWSAENVLPDNGAGPLVVTSRGGDDDAVSSARHRHLFRRRGCGMPFPRELSSSASFQGEREI